MTRAPKAAELPTKDDAVEEPAVEEAKTERPDPDKVHSANQKQRAKDLAFSGYKPGE